MAGKFVSRRGVATALALLSTTALSTVLLSPVTIAKDAGRVKNTSRPSSQQPAAMPLPADVAAVLNSAAGQGRHRLVASVFESVYRQPDLRDSVLSHVRGMETLYSRELITAADLGTLTAGKTLALAPAATAVLGQRFAPVKMTAPTPVMPTAAAQVSPRALPNPAPSTSDQTWHLGLIGASVAYGRGYTGQGVTVAVGDSGFDTTNDALRNKLDLSRARNYVVNTANTPYDPNFVGIQSATDTHGSHVAGIIAAERLPGVAMHGIAYDSTVVPIRVILAGNDAPLAVYASGLPDSDPTALSLSYFASLANVKVYNGSYGPSPDNNSPPLSAWKVGPRGSEYDAAMSALSADKLIVVANGNSREEHPLAGRNPSGLALMPFIQPAHNGTGVYELDGENENNSALLSQRGLIISVMSVGQAKQAASYSQLCGVTASWCLAAPGGNQPNGQPGGNAPNDAGIFSTVPDNTYAFLHGTSMAAPAVSGALAVLIEAYPGYNARDLARVLFSTAEDLGNAGVDGVYGYGLIRLDRATDGPTTLAASSTLNVNDGDTTYWSQPLTTSGGFTKIGEGVLTIAGRTTAPGQVQVNLGTLAVDGTLTVTGAGNALGISLGGTLAGIGDIVGNTTIAGTLSPGRMPNVGDLIANGVLAPGSTVVGNSPGTLSFNGNITLMASATTRVDVDGGLLVPGGPGTHDKIVVSGANHVFTAGGTLMPVLRGIAGGNNDYTPTLGTKFNFVEAQGGARVAGNFDTLIQPGSGLAANTRFDAVYGATQIALAVTPLTFAGMADDAPLTQQQSFVAQILDRTRGATSGNAASILNSIYLQSSDAEYREALTQLSGPGQPATPGAVMSTFSAFGNAISNRQGVVLSGGGAAQSAVSQTAGLGYAGAPVAEMHPGEKAFASIGPGSETASGWSMWGQAFGRWSSVNSDSRALLPGATARSAGFAIGADRLLSPDLLGGMAAGYARTTTASAGTNATSDSYSGSLYATWTPGAWVFDGRLAAGPTTLSTSRSTNAFGSSSGSATGFGGLVAGEAGYRITLPAATLKPFAGLEWQTFLRRAYVESNTFGLAYPSQTFDKLVAKLGTSVATRIKTQDGLTITPEAKFAWAHDMRDTTLTTQAALLDNSFTAQAAAPGRDAAQVGLTLTGWRQESFRLFASYAGEFRRNGKSHEVSGGGRWSW